MFKIGDIVICYIEDMGEKDRPCLIIGKTKGKYKILPITSNNELNEQNKVKIDIGLISCCNPLGGYLWVESKQLNLIACKQRDICDCIIGWKLEIYLKTRDININ